MAIGPRRVLESAPVRPPDAAMPPRPPIPWICWGVIASSAAVFLADQATRQIPLAWLALYGPLVVEAGQWWRVLTCVFTHGSTLHIFFNLSVVATFGVALERQLGSARFALISLVTALGSAALVLALAYNLPTVGASGMIIGWLGATLPIANRQARRDLALWLVQIALISALPLLFPAIRISWQGHLGGFLAGIPCGLVLRNQLHRFYPLTWALLAAAVVATVVAGFVGRSLGGVL